LGVSQRREGGHVKSKKNEGENTKGPGSGLPDSETKCGMRSFPGMSANRQQRKKIEEKPQKKRR